MTTITITHDALLIFPEPLTRLHRGDRFEHSAAFTGYHTLTLSRKYFSSSCENGNNSPNKEKMVLQLREVIQLH